MKKNFIRILSLVLVFVLMGAIFVACDKKDDKDDRKKDSAPNKDPKKAEEDLKEAGYEAHLIEYDEVGEEGLKATLVASKGEDIVQIAYYDNKEAATKAYETAKERYDAAKEIAEAAGVEYDMILKQAGTMVYMGTKQAVKDAK